MPSACCLIRHDNHYSRREYAEGLKAAGFTLIDEPRSRPASDDLLVTWNRHGGRDEQARRYEAAGAKVIVTENGWIGKANNGGKFYSLCLGQHNGAGQWRVGEADRFPLLNVELKPWRERGDYILVLASRGIGSPSVRMPRGWEQDVYRRLKAITKRQVKVRPHPGDKFAPFEPHIAGAHAVVTWASGAGIKAIAAGIPAFYELKDWIGAPAAKYGIADIENPFLGDRLPMFRRLAWAQWSAQEISTGEPFRWLLGLRS